MLFGDYVAADMDGAHVEVWVILSVAAAAFQTLRFMLQKVLSSTLLTPTGATFARFVYSAPLVGIVMAFYLSVMPQAPALPSSAFWVFAALGGLAQVFGTVCVVTLFQSRNFAVGVTLMKTEVLLSVLIGLLLLGETIHMPALLAIGAGFAGVLILSPPPEHQTFEWSLVWNRSMALGIGAGAFFAVSAVCYRGASLEIVSSDPVARAGVTLAVVTGLQMIGLALWLVWRDRAQISAVWQARRVAVWIGLLSLAGSACWFLAFTLKEAAFVKAVGQIELVLSLLASVFFFGERPRLRELAGMLVLAGSILALVLVA